MIDEVVRLQPDAVTLNEGCQGDVDAVVAELRARGLDYSAATVNLHHDGQCSAGRGTWVNAVIAEGGITKDPASGYFEEGGYRAWMCGIARGVRVCTAHLSLPSQEWGGYKHQSIECNVLRARLRDTGGHPTVFAGDTNYKHDKDNCMPTGFFGLQDFPVGADEDSPGTVGLQHVYYSDDFTRGETCGHVPAEPETDHAGFWIELQAADTPDHGAACTWRDVRPEGWAPSSKWLHGYDFQTEAHSRWTGPAATRLALTMQAQKPSQEDLAAELGTTSTDGTASIENVTGVLNDHIAADGGPRFYETKSTPTVSLLKADMRYDFLRGFAIVARVRGRATDTSGGGHYAEYGRYVAVVGYSADGDRLTVEDVLKDGADVEHRRYDMATAEFVDWLYQGYSA